MTVSAHAAWARGAAPALFSALLILLLAACTGDSDAWQRIQSGGVLRVGLDPTYPPFETADGGELRGIDVDLARAIGEQLDLDVQFVYFGYDGLYDALATEQVDLLISALVIRPDQRRDFAFSDPYFNAGQRLVASQSGDIAGMDDLSGRTLAVELGAQGHVTATEWQRRIPDLTIRPYQTSQEALDAVASGAAGAALVDGISAHLHLAQHPTLHILEPPVTVEPYAIVVRIEDERLLQELNKALETLEQNGRLQTILTHHLSG